jgi:ATP-binding cassette subfamily F protein 3
MVAMERPHLLILDEPTNHLDVDSRRALLDALNEYDGAVILITHDRSLMELVADRLWLAADGTIRPFDGDMEDYARFVLDRARVAARAPTQVAAPEPVAAPPPPPARKAKVPTGPARRRAEAAEAALARAADALAQIDRALADPAVFTAQPAKAADLGRRRTVAQAAMEAAELEWMEAHEAYEAVKGEA